MRGLSFGANDRKVEWSRPCGFWAVPVLPQTSQPSSRATVALPIASLVEEYYLTDTITRPWLVDRVKNMQIYYPSYAK